MRHIAIGGGVLRELNDLRAPMAGILDFFVQQQKELQQYRRMYGALPEIKSDKNSAPQSATEAAEAEGDTDGGNNEDGS